MTREEFFHELQEIFGPAAADIRGDELLENLGWDSMARVMFLAMADETLHQSISGVQLADCKTVDDLIVLFPGKIS